MTVSILSVIGRFRWWSITFGDCSGGIICGSVDLRTQEKEETQITLCESLCQAEGKEGVDREKWKRAQWTVGILGMWYECWWRITDGGRHGWRKSVVAAMKRWRNSVSAEMRRCIGEKSNTVRRCICSKKWWRESLEREGSYQCHGQWWVKGTMGV